MSARAGLLVVLLAGLSQVAQAQVYSWQEPQSGATRMSNVAPAWYRKYPEVTTGPRVIVTLDARVVDDTALALEKRLELMRRPAPRAAARFAWQQ